MFIKFYQRYLSPLSHFFGRAFFGSSYACRFHPTCSEYFVTAVAKYGIIHGGFLGIKRLFRCHPYSQSPHLDPVPRNTKYKISRRRRGSPKAANNKC